MPIFDKPDWIKHGGAAVLGVDIDAAGERLATCGSDNKVRIWSMRPIISETAEVDSAVPKQLAALSEFTTPVNCVRFAPAGRLLAAGSDDADAYVFELREGRGSALFGSGEAANIENWKLRLRLRGHEINVADLAWAPDSRRLATASVDNKVKIWDTSTGQCLRTLEGHEGHVKGVAWDPFDHYLASQGDHEVIVWRLEDGQQACRLLEPFRGAPIVSFALRPSWSPDGQILALPNGYENGLHVVPLIRRNTWAAKEFSLVGHRAPVIAVRHNPHMYMQPMRAGEGAAAAADDEDAAAGSITAIGSTDKSFSIWHPAVSAPLLVGRGFFERMVNDLAWSSDGRLMVGASQDGGVTVVVFQEAELGRVVPEVEVQALMTKLYGDPRARSQKTALTAAPDLLQLETRARVDMEREERLKNRLGPGVAPAAAAPAPPAWLPPAPATAVPSNGPASAAQPNRPAVGPTVTATQRATSPSKPLPPSAAAARAGGAGTSGRDPEAQPPNKRPALQGAQLGAGVTTLPAALPPAAAAVALAGHPRPVSAAGWPTAGDGPSASPSVTSYLVPPPTTKSLLSVLISAQSGSEGEARVSMELQAKNTGRDARQRPVAELMCLAGCRRMWWDTVQGYIVALAGSGRMVAASTTNGDLMVYNIAGRRVFPPIRLGSPVSFLCLNSSGCVLLALLADGQLRSWDMGAGESLVEASVGPLLAGGEGGQQKLRVAQVRLTASGAPVVVLSNDYAYVYHQGMRCWMRMADDAFPASAYTTSLASATPGELSRLQTGTAQRRTPHEVLSASAATSGRPAAITRSEQALLEHNLAAAAVLQSPVEWRLWLIAYVRRLAVDEDESRLRDLIAEFLGPLRFSGASHPGATAALPSGSGRPGADGGGGGAACGSLASEPPLSSTLAGRWQPVILGFDKRRLLREVVLKEVAKNRVYQQLVAEVLDQLKHLEGTSSSWPPPPPVQSGGAGSVGGGVVGGGGTRSLAGWGGGGVSGGTGALWTSAQHPQPQLHSQPMVLG